jgi:hypothetical protein
MADRPCVAIECGQGERLSPYSAARLFSRLAKLNQHGAPKCPVFVRDGLNVASMGLLNCSLAAPVTTDHVDGYSLSFIIHRRHRQVATVPPMQL